MPSRNVPFAPSGAPTNLENDSVGAAGAANTGTSEVLREGLRLIERRDKGYIADFYDNRNR